MRNNLSLFMGRDRISASKLSMVLVYLEHLYTVCITSVLRIQIQKL